VAAGRKADARSVEALASVCEMYWFPVCVHPSPGLARTKAPTSHRRFFARVIEKDYPERRRSRERALFRSFLCASIRHFLSNERDRARTLKRGGHHPTVSLDVETADGMYRLEPRDDLTPDKLFDRRWALVLLERVLANVRDQQVSAGKGELFDRLKGFLTGDNTGTPYAGVATSLGMTEGAVKVAGHRLRRQFRDTLMQEIADTVADPADIDGEIQYLAQSRQRVTFDGGRFTSLTGMNPSSPLLCPRCGTVRAAQAAPLDLCPACLLTTALSMDDEPPYRS
jgi:RNA polymerase sigma-70 factor (ECF subfamily)